MELLLPELLASVRENPQVFAFAPIGRVSEAVAIAANMPEIAGYVLTVDAHGIQHSLKQHGDPHKESLRGQTALNWADFALLPAIFTEPDLVTPSGKSRLGLPVVTFTKHIGNYTYTCAAEVRTVVSAKKLKYKANRLVLMTLYKRKTA
jgi:hypothetical protein